LHIRRGNCSERMISLISGSYAEALMPYWGIAVLEIMPTEELDRATIERMSEGGPVLRRVEYLRTLEGSLRTHGLQDLALIKI